MSDTYDSSNSNGSGPRKIRDGVLPPSCGCVGSSRDHASCGNGKPYKEDYLMRQFMNSIQGSKSHGKRYDGGSRGEYHHGHPQGHHDPRGQGEYHHDRSQGHHDPREKHHHAMSDLDQMKRFFSDMMEQLKTEMKNLMSAGTNTEILQKRIESLQKDNENLQKDNEILQKDNEILRNTNEILSDRCKALLQKLQSLQENQ